MTLSIQKDNKKMKIIYLHQYFSVPSSSAGTRSYDLAKKFFNQGHSVKVITTSAFLKALGPFPNKWNVLDYEGLELHILRLEYDNKLSFFKRTIAFLKFFVLASAKILKIKGDVVLATSTPITIAVPAIVKKAFHKTPFVFEVRDVWPEVPVAMGIIKNKIVIKMLNHFEAFIYKKASHVVPLSNDMSNSIVKRTKMDESKLTIISNISEINRFKQYEADKGLFAELLGFKPQKAVLYAGTLGMVNGLKYMIDLAYHTLPIDPSIIYIIFGDGMEKKDLIEYAKNKSVLNKNLFFQETVPKSKLAQIYYECTVASSFVIPVPELWANSANKFFDCLAAGRPIVINHRGWQADIIERENIGFVLNYDRAQLLYEAERFCNYINNADILLQQCRNAKSLAESRFSLEIASNKYVKVLNKVASV